MIVTENQAFGRDAVRSTLSRGPLSLQDLCERLRAISTHDRHRVRTTVAWMKREGKITATGTRGRSIYVLATG